MKVSNPHNGAYYGAHNSKYVQCTFCESEDIHAMNCELELTSSNIPEGQIGGERLGPNYCLCRICYFAYINEVQRVTDSIKPQLKELMKTIRYWHENPITKS